MANGNIPPTTPPPPRSPKETRLPMVDLTKSSSHVFADLCEVVNGKERPYVIDLTSTATSARKLNPVVFCSSAVKAKAESAAAAVEKPKHPLEISHDAQPVAPSDLPAKWKSQQEIDPKTR